MSTNNTITMLDMYRQRGGVTRFLSGFFQTPARNFYNTKSVEIDVKRGDESIATPVIMGTGPNMNASKKYTNKNFIAPAYDEAFPLDAFELLDRVAGRNPFESPSFRADVLETMMDEMEDHENRIRRSIELQASQVMQTGVVTLIDSAGNTVYTVDFKPKTAHFPTVSTAWSNPAADARGDLLSLINVIRNNGLKNPNQLIFAENAFEHFVNNTTVKALLDLRRADLGAINPMREGVEGGQYRGTVEIGNYKLDMWTYGGRYKHPSTGTVTQYIADNKVIVKAADSRLDLTFGAVPNLNRILGRSLFPELGGGRFQSAATGVDMFTNIYMPVNGRSLIGEVASRPLCIPTAIDQFGCLTTTP